MEHDHAKQCVYCGTIMDVDATYCPACMEYDGLVEIEKEEEEWTN